jgi:hypothetical protein
VGEEAEELPSDDIPGLCVDNLSANGNYLIDSVGPGDERERTSGRLSRDFDIRQISALCIGPLLLHHIKCKVSDKSTGFFEAVFVFTGLAFEPGFSKVKSRLGPR